MNLYLRRPTEQDKVAVLEMFHEFQDENSRVHGCFNLDTLDYEAWLQQNLDYEMGFVPDTFVPNIEFVLVDDTEQLIGFFNLRLALNQRLLDNRGILVILSARRNDRRAMERQFYS